MRRRQHLRPSFQHHCCSLRAALHHRQIEAARSSSSSSSSSRLTALPADDQMEVALPADDHESEPIDTAKAIMDQLTEVTSPVVEEHESSRSL